MSELHWENVPSSSGKSLHHGSDALLIQFLLFKRLVVLLENQIKLLPHPFVLEKFSSMLPICILADNHLDICGFLGTPPAWYVISWLIPPRRIDLGFALQHFSSLGVLTKKSTKPSGFEIIPAILYARMDFTRLEFQQLIHRCSVYEHLLCLTLAQPSAEV